MARRLRRRAARLRRRLRRSLGSVIIFALTVLTPILVAGGTVLTSLKSYSEEVEHRVHSITAQLIAASGAHQGLATIARDLGFRGKIEFAMNGGRFFVDVSQIAGATTPELTDDLLQVRSEGWLNGPVDGEAAPPGNGVRWYRSVVTATARPRVLKFNVDQTLFVGDPNAQVYFSGPNFRIAGEDSSVNPKPTLPGIGVAGDAMALASQIPSMLQQYVTGAPAQSTASVLQTPPVNVNDWIERFHRKATIEWDQTTTTLDTCDLGTSSQPAVAFADGGLDVRGTVTGFGILVVRGDLRVSGSFDFNGIVVVGGAAIFRSATSAPTNIHGAFMVNGSDLRRDLEVTGNVQVRYDSTVVEQLVGNFVDGVELVTWDHDLDAGAPGTGLEAGGGSP